MESDDLVLLKSALDQIDTATTAAGTSTATIQGNLTGILAQIATDAANGKNVSAAVAQAQGEVAKLAPIVDALNAMAQSTATPVPTPVPPATPVTPTPAP